MGTFSSIPTRSNGQKVMHDWFNTIKSAGTGLETFLGGGYTSETKVNILNSQATPVQIAGFNINATLYTSAYVFAEVRRKTIGGGEKISVGRLLFYYNTALSSWTILDELGGDDDGVTFTVDTNGNLFYTSDTLAGTSYTGTLKYKTITFGV